MALNTIRNRFLSMQKLNEALIFSTRTIALTTTRRTTVEESKNNQQNPVPPLNENKNDEKLTQEILQLTEKNTELLDKYKRALADGENLRNRLTKQISDAKLFGIQGFCKDLLDVADVLNRATETIPKEQISAGNPHLKSLHEGLVMTEAQLQSVFKRHGLEKVNPINEKFDPNFHEALFQQETEGKESGVVINVSKIGYKLHDRVIRPALVGVSK